MKYCSLWYRAQGVSFCYPDAKRCSRCGRRIDFDNYASVFAGINEENNYIIIDTICKQHGGTHRDCQTGQVVNFGKQKHWPLIFISNTLDEIFFWAKVVFRFLYLGLSFYAHVALHPIRYYRYVVGRVKR